MAQELPIALPEGRKVPDKHFFRIGEVANLLGVEPHVVRFWQQQFPQVRPERSDTGRLLFGRPALARLARIRALLYDQGFTIAGAKKALNVDAAPVKPAEIVYVETKVLQPHDDKAEVALRAEVDRLTRELRSLEARLSASEASEAAVRRQLAGVESRLDAELRAALGEVEAMLTVWPA
jgi:DNA-binding transcriptional MerR regulator